MANQNRFDNTHESLLSQGFVSKRHWKVQHIRLWGSCLKAHLLLSILHNHPLPPTGGKLFTDTLYACTMDAQLHQLMSNLTRLPLYFAAKIDDKSDYFSFDLFKEDGRGKQNKRQMQMISDRSGFIP